MVNKKELFKDLQQGLIFEEEAVRKYSYFLEHLVWKRAIKHQSWEGITIGLSTLRKDPEKHEHMIKDIIKYVEGSNKNEF